VEDEVPTYQYACNDCGHDFEQFQSFTDDALTVCPQCEGRLRKVYNAVGVVFKGSGFYRNDSRTDGRPAAANGTSGDSETKPAPAGSDTSKESSTPTDGATSAPKSAAGAPAKSDTKKSSGAKDSSAA
jgi:putative FmdB family regulatory protein